MIDGVHLKPPRSLPRWPAPWHFPQGRLPRRLAYGLIVVVNICISLTGSANELSSWPHQQQVGPFRIHADFPLDTHQTLLGQLIHLRSDIEELLGLPPSNEAIDIYLFHDKRVYEQYLKRYFPNLQPRRAMFIKANSPGNVFAYDSAELAVDLRHECTHAILHSALLSVPLWLDEGLAEYFEVPAAERSAHHEYLRSVRWGTRWKRPRDLSDLESLERLEQMGASEYRDAWAWVHFMVHGQEQGRAALQAYVRELTLPARPIPLSARLRSDINGLDQAFATHFRHWPTVR